MSKASISMIQTALRDLGFSPGPIDGLYGAKTKAAAQALVATGHWTATPVIAIALLQTGLRDLGRDPGRIDGLYGSRTEVALSAWIAGRGTAAGTLLAPVTAAAIYQGLARYLVDEIVVHCSATLASWMAKASFAAQFAEIRRWHMVDRGWQDIGYHWLISRSGQVLAGRAENKIGAHVVDHNRGTLGICLIGGFGSSETDRFADHFTPAQDTTLRQLIQGIGMRTPISRVSGHNEWAAKACPGFNVPKWLKEAA